MSERRLRAILAIAMLVTLFLPVDPPRTTGVNLTFILWYSMEALASFIGVPGIALIDWLRLVLFLLGILGVPLLILLNLCLLARSFRGLRIVYRIFLLILLPLTSYGAFQLDPGWRAVGFWAYIAVISAAALIEIFFVVRERLKKPQNAPLL